MTTETSEALALRRSGTRWGLTVADLATPARRHVGAKHQCSATDEDFSCSYGRCVEWRCACGKRIGAAGPITCPCDHTPGWRARHPEQAGKPRVAALPKGRHRGRVQRSIRRHDMSWLKREGWLRADSEEVEP